MSTAEVSPAQLAQCYEFSQSTNTLTLKSGKDIGGVDTFQLGFDTRGTQTLDAAFTFIAAQHVDLTDYTAVRMATLVSAAGSVAQVAKFQYSLDGTTYVDFTNTLSLTSTGLKRTAFEDIPAAARTVVTVRVGLGGGNGADPLTMMGTILQFRR